MEYNAVSMVTVIYGDYTHFSLSKYTRVSIVVLYLRKWH